MRCDVRWCAAPPCCLSAPRRLVAHTHTREHSAGTDMLCCVVRACVFLCAASRRVRTASAAPPTALCSGARSSRFAAGAGTWAMGAGQTCVTLAPSGHAWRSECVRRSGSGVACMGVGSALAIHPVTLRHHQRGRAGAGGGVCITIMAGRWPHSSSVFVSWGLNRVSPHQPRETTAWLVHPASPSLW